VKLLLTFTVRVLARASLVKMRVPTPPPVVVTLAAPDEALKVAVSALPLGMFIGLQFVPSFQLELVAPVQVTRVWARPIVASSAVANVKARSRRGRCMRREG
jgi:hypothetical protein